jgi:hypothetical protein
MEDSKYKSISLHCESTSVKMSARRVSCLASVMIDTHADREKNNCFTVLFGLFYRTPINISVELHIHSEVVITIPKTVPKRNPNDVKKRQPMQQKEDYTYNNFANQI